jgi:methylase of polypeptide subunit release factors
MTRPRFDDATALEQKKAEIEKLLEEFSFHLSELDRISREAGQLMVSFGAFVREHGGKGAEVGLELFQKLQRIAAKHERLQGRGTNDVV